MVHVVVIPLFCLPVVSIDLASVCVCSVFFRHWETKRVYICPGVTIVCPGGTIVCPGGTFVCPGIVVQS